MQRVSLSFLSPLSLIVFGCLMTTTVKAQVSPDGTTSTTVNQDGNNFTIEEGDRAGDNLFHSFDEFSVPTQGSAAFNNAGDIANIFSRVTGSNISNIDGLLGANGAANLYLINPNGIIFGRNARLDLGGSFFASTADSLLFEGGEEFSASNPQATSLLEVSIPIGLSFRDNPGDIVNRSFVQNSTGELELVGLEVLFGNTLALIGGDINFEAGEVTAKGGNIYLGGLAEEGIINFNEDGSLNFPDNLTLANISLNDAADVDVRGEGGGNVVVDAQSFSLTAGDFGSSLIRGGLSADSISAEAQAGDIVIDVARNITVDNSVISNQVGSGGMGNVGNIIISTGSLELTNGGTVNASTAGGGNAGALEITTTADITVNGENSNGFSSGITSRVNTDAVGDSGGITISTTNLNLMAGGTVDSNTAGEGNAGAVEITATGDIIADGEDSDGFSSGITSQVGPDAVGDSGGVTISTTNLNLIAGGTVDAGTGGEGNAGIIEITATGDITADGDSDGFQSGITSQVRPGAVGEAGGVTISTTNLNLIAEGRVDSSTGGEGNAGAIDITTTGDITADGEDSDGSSSGITSQVDTDAVGEAGGVTISTTNLNLIAGGRVDSSTLGEGNAGAIDITTTGDITADGEDSNGFPGGITSVVEIDAIGEAGGVTISTTNLNLMTGGRVDSDTFGEGNAGSVTIEATESITINGLIERFRSGISANAINQDGDGGDISISTGTLNITNGGTIEATNFEDIELESSPGTGRPGNINITANSIDLTNDAIIETATQFIGEASANIDLQVAEDIRLENNSFISAQAFENANGGNLTINADDGFILASTSNGDNDIIARAEQGTGGQIEIFTQALFGFEERPATLNNGTNDIDASSEFGLQGDFSLNTPDFDPTSGLINLPASVGDASDQISQNPCQQGVGSEFKITGKGGLPPTVNEALNSESSQVGLIEAVPSQQTGKANSISSETPAQEATPAMGWVFNDKGEVTLTSYSTSETSTRPTKKQAQHSCSNG